MGEERERETDFGLALGFLKKGRRVYRTGWNGKGMWLILCKNAEFYGSDTKYEILPFILMKTVDDKLIPWLASQTDMLAQDWAIFPGSIVA